MTWITVDERQPKPGDTVLGYGPLRNGRDADSKGCEVVNFDSVYKSFEAEHIRVTHWMPLPASPDQESDAPT